MVTISAGLRPQHKKAVVTVVKPKGYDVRCEGETTDRHVSEKKVKALSSRKTPSLSVQRPVLTEADIKELERLPDRRTIAILPRTQPVLSSVEQVVRSLKPTPKPRPRWRSAEYLKFVGEHDCCGCGKHGPSDAHHWGGSKGMALKVDDLLTVPLCNGCHIEGFHRTGKLPGMTLAETHLRFRETQVALLVEWILLKFTEVS